MTAATSNRKPVFVTKQQMTAMVGRKLGWYWYLVRFHGVRAVSVYPLRLVESFPIGVIEAIKMWWDWMRDNELRPLARDIGRTAVVTRKATGSAVSAFKLVDQHVKTRLSVSAGVAAAYVLAMLWFFRWSEGEDAPLVGAGIVAATVLLIGYIGRVATEGKLVSSPPPSRMPVSRQLLAEALHTLDIPRMNKWFKIHEASDLGIWHGRTVANDGDRIEIALPVTAREVIKKQDAFAGNIGRRASQVFLEHSPEDDPNRLVVIVLDNPPDYTDVKPYEVPGVVDIFKGLEIGRTQGRGRFTLDVLFQTILVGALPRQGKSYLCRLIAALADEDERVEIVAVEMKGTGDFAGLRSVATAYRSGDDPDDLQAVLEISRWLAEEVRRRLSYIGQLFEEDPMQAPENKITPELADDGMPVIVVLVDEFQEITTHPEYGKEFMDNMDVVLRRGGTAGVITIFSTQHINADVLTGTLSALFTTRIALRTASSKESNAILESGLVLAKSRSALATKS